MTITVTMSREARVTLEILARHAASTPEALRPEQSLKQLGIDSLKFIVLILEIDHGLKRQVFDIDKLARLRTVGDLLRLVQPPAG